MARYDFEGEKRIIEAALAQPTDAEGFDSDKETSMFGKKDIQENPKSAVPPPPDSAYNQSAQWKSDPMRPKTNIYNENAFPQRKPQKQWRPKLTPEQVEENAKKRWDYAQRWCPVSLRQPYPGSSGRGDPEAVTHRSALGGRKTYQVYLHPDPAGGWAIVPGAAAQRSRSSTEKSASGGWRGQWPSSSGSWNRGRSWAGHR